MEAAIAHHGRSRNTQEVTGVEKASKAKVEMARVRAVEKAAVVAANGKRSATGDSPALAAAGVCMWCSPSA
jgi:hypothetical protein